MSSAARWNEREYNAGRLTDDHYRDLCPDHAERDWLEFADRVMAFQSRYRMHQDGLAGYKTRMGLEVCRLPRCIPVEPWHGRDAVVSSPFGDPRSDGPHRGADYMFRLQHGETTDHTYKGTWCYPTWARACARGTVVAIARLANGAWVRIDHGCKTRSQYGHLGDIEVEVGQVVALGQRLGGPAPRSKMWPLHLHFGWQAGWAGGIVRGYQDPELWLRSATP